MRIRIRCKDAEIQTNALLNSGFEAETPQLLIPRSLAVKLGLWPPPPEAQLVEVGTAGGPVRNYLIPSAADVLLDAGDRVVGPVKCDVMISSLEYEVLVSDALISAFNIVMLDVKWGKWRLSDEEKVRHTEVTQYWF